MATSNTAAENPRWQAIERAYVTHRTEKRRERDIAKARAGKLTAPRKYIYFPLIFIAISADIAGVAAIVADLTGFGAVIVSVVSLLVAIFFFIISVLVGRKIATSRRLGEEFGAHVTRFERQIQLLRQTTASAARLIRRAGGTSFLRSAYQRRAFTGAVKGISRFTKFAGKYLKYVQVVMETIPFINMLPWYTINMVLVYRERKEEYAAAMAAAAQFTPVDVDEENAFSDFIRARVAQWGTRVATRKIIEAVQEASVTDIARPGTARPIQQRPRPIPVATTPMRDVAVAA